MKVRLDRKHPEAKNYNEFVDGEVYLVVGVEGGHLRVVGEFQRPFLYPRDLFEVVDASIPGDWVVKSDRPGEETKGPEAFLEVGFYEDFFDGVQEVEEQVFSYLERLRAADASEG